MICLLRLSNQFPLIHDVSLRSYTCRFLQKEQHNIPSLSKVVVYNIFNVLAVRGLVTVLITPSDREIRSWNLIVHYEIRRLLKSLCVTRLGAIDVHVQYC